MTKDPSSAPDATAPAEFLTATTAHVILERSDKVFVARIVGNQHQDQCEYAFYFHRDNVRFATRWYESSNQAEFTDDSYDHEYFVTGFVRNRQTNALTIARSNQIQVPMNTIVAVSGNSLFGPVITCDSSDIEAQVAHGGVSRFDVTGPHFTWNCLLKRQPSNRLFVVLGGAVRHRKERSIPRFNRFTWSQDFPGNFISIADPTLTLKDSLQLGWYFGNSRRDAIAELAEIVKAWAQALQVPPDRIVAYGSSGGGFAALMLVSHLGHGATAIAINAQTSIIKYSQIGAVNAFLKACTSATTQKAAVAQHANRLSAIEAWSGTAAQSGRCLLVQNTHDRHHHHRHFLPFLNAMGVSVGTLSADGRIDSMTYSDATGHGAEPRALVNQILERALNRPPVATVAANLPTPVQDRAFPAKNSATEASSS